MTAPGQGAAGLRVELLGPLRVVVAGREVPVTSAKQRALLTALAIQPTTVVPVDRLVDALWGDDPPRSARNALQTYVARLRERLGVAAGALATAGAGYGLAPGVVVDVVEVEALLAEGAHPDPGAEVAALDRALARWRGASLEEFAGGFARAEAVRLDALRRRARLRRARLVAAIDGPGAAVAELGALVAEDPLDGEGADLAMRVLHAAGRSADALGVYDRHRTAMREELGLDPVPMLADLHAALLRGDAAARLAPVRRASPTVGVEVAAAGPSVTVDGRAPVVGSAVPTRRVERTSARVVPPSPPVPMFGRDGDLERLATLLAAHRLVTVTGPGGVGKTALAAALAADRGDVRWVGLGTTRVREDVVAALLEALAPGDPARDGAEELVVEAARRLDGLLVLDNLEHVAPAVAELVVRMTEHAAGVTVLMTSREPVGVPGEARLRLGPLPAEVDGRPGPAVALLQARVALHADADEPSTPTAVRLCRRLDGLPLAIELAAARIGSLGVDDLVERLEDRFAVLSRGARTAPPRHRTLRAVVDWSHDLLAPPERTLFRRLGVFPGRFRLGDVEQVCGVDLAPGQAADVLGALVDRSMVVHEGGGVYRLLETLRAYARERLVGSADDGPVGDRFEEHVVTFLRDASERLRGSDEGAASAAIEARFDDIREVRARALARGDADTVATLAALLYDHAYWRRAPVLRWGEAALEADPRHPLRVDALAAAITGRWMTGDQAGARALAATVAEQSGAGPHAARFVEAQSDLALVSGEPIAALDPPPGGVDATSGGPYHRAIIEGNRALALAYHGDAAARTVAERVVAEAEAAGLGSPTVMARYALGEALATTDPEAAIVELDRAAELAERVGNRLMADVAATAAVAVRARAGDADEALQAFDEVVERWTRTGAVRFLWVALRNLVVLFERIGSDVAAVTLHAAVTRHAPAGAYGAEAERLTGSLRAARDRLGPRRAAAAEAVGAAMDVDATVAAAHRWIREA